MKRYFSSDFLRNFVSSLGLGRLWHSYRYVASVVVGGLLIGLAIYQSSQVAAMLYSRELRFTADWQGQMAQLQHDMAVSHAPLQFNFEAINPNIPYVLVDGQRQVIASNIFDLHASGGVPDLQTLNRTILSLGQQNEPILFSNIWRDERYILFYGPSVVLVALERIPFLQLGIALIYLVISLLVLGLTRQAEQNRLWVGLAKETAHQLGTPTSSLMGWLEYLRDSGVGPDALDEMERDLERLRSVSERFSKIGSDTALECFAVAPLVREFLHYFRPRVPKGVVLHMDSDLSEDLCVALNKTLFEWVIENLLKNALDAMSGQGQITVVLRSNRGKVTLDVCDSGRGLERGLWRRIFEPGYSTKQRGWGLGLSLSRRIVEQYHGGTIAVVGSTAGVGTTVRVTLRQLCD